MLIHSIVYTVLSILSATTVYAASMPIGKAPREQQEAPEVNKDTTTPSENK